MSIALERPLVAVTLAVLGALGSATAHADAPAPEGVVSLASSASIDVTKDLLAITFATTKEGADAAAVQSQLKQALDAALTEARRVAKPGQVDVQTGNFSLTPRYTSKGVVNGWQGSAELLVQGRDVPAIAQLSGRITTLSIRSVGYDLSRELREKSEGDVTAQAIARYRAKASDYAKQFGYAGYTIREVNVSTNEPGPVYRPQMMMKAMAAPAPSDEALPVEAGKGTVTVNVNGTVQMK